MPSWFRILSVCFALQICPAVYALNGAADADLSSTGPESEAKVKSYLSGWDSIPAAALERFKGLGKAPKLIKRGAPKLIPGHYGIVLVSVRTDEEGGVVAVDPIYGDALLFQSVARSLRASTFEPTGKSQTFGTFVEFLP